MTADQIANAKKAIRFIANIGVPSSDPNAGDYQKSLLYLWRFVAAVEEGSTTTAPVASVGGLLPPQ